mmetsp:Transcript_110808/g.357667  ORF Transcript_110808/g.357667 Transcript_110808/m.357667 type:complete len:204 (+) Transcript_110808:753-1364(+)
MLHGNLSLLGIRDGLGMLGLLSLAHVRCLSLLLPEFRNLITELLDFLGQLCTICGALVNLCRELLHLHLLVLPGLLVSCHLREAISLLVSLRIRLFHEFHDQVLHHSLDLSEWVCAEVSSHEREVAASDTPCPVLQESCGALLRLRLPRHISGTGPELDERDPHPSALDEHAAADRAALQNADCRLDRLDLLGAEHLVLLELP